MPAWVFVPLPAAFAMPKSMSFTSPSNETRTFCGETSRWTRCELAARLVALVVRVVEALADLHHDEARLRDRHRLAGVLVDEACEGLDYAHDKRDQAGRELHLIHRDVSPQHVLVSFEGEVS